MKRKDNPISISLQARDLALLRTLFESRVMIAEHVATLYFDGHAEAAKKRLQKLKAAELIGTRPRRAFEPAILFLAAKGLAILKANGTLAEYPALGVPALGRRVLVSELTLRHELEIMDVKASFHAALLKTKAFSLTEFCTWPLLYQFEAFRPRHDGTEVIVKPDGFIRVHEAETDGGLSEHTFFLEVDRSSETVDTLVAKAGCYLDYFKSGGFAERNGAPRSAFKEYPFRVLMVFKTAERRNNVAERLFQSNPPILSQVCLSTFEEVAADPLGKIWILPLAYREATKGTAFDPSRARKQWGYQRDTAREHFIEQKVKKIAILADQQ